MKRVAVALVAVLCSVWGSWAEADVVELESGEKIVGIVVAESSDKVVIETFPKGELKLRTVPRIEDRKIVRAYFERPKAGTDAGGGKAKYFLIPLHGVVGKEIQAGKIHSVMMHGLTDPATVLVLDIDSPGGLVSECEKIIQLFSETSSRRSIAFIRNAYSAAAIIALTCDEIYMREGAAIGAATALAVATTKPGGPVKVGAVEEKLQSAWRATCRLAASVGGHDPRFAEAMVDADMQLRVVMKDGKRLIEPGAELSAEDHAEKRVLTEKGKLLTMTALEAHRFGLAEGVVSDFSGVAALATGASDWVPVCKVGENVMADFRREAERAEARVKKLTDNASKQILAAASNDPTRGSYRKEQDGSWTVDSRRTWINLSRACSENLSRCESAMKDLEEIGRDFPVFQPEARWAEDLRRQIQLIRQRIRQDGQRLGF
jgi:membrane-bound serine protease (ClpP class)